MQVSQHGIGCKGAIGTILRVAVSPAQRAAAPTVNPGWFLVSSRKSRAGEGSRQWDCQGDLHRCLYGQHIEQGCVYVSVSATARRCKVCSSLHCCGMVVPAITKYARNERAEHFSLRKQKKTTASALEYHTSTLKVRSQGWLKSSHVLK